MPKTSPLRRGPTSPRDVGDELVPCTIVDRLLAGEDSARVWREYRGLAQADLAAASGVPAADIEDMDAGRHELSLATLKTFAIALQITLDDLV